MADDAVPLSSLPDWLAARASRAADVPLSSLLPASTTPIDYNQWRLPENVGFDREGRPVRLIGTDVMGLTPLIAQGMEAGKRIMADPRAFLGGAAPLENPLDNPTATGEEAGSMVGAIKAYHGSPHDFDRFDISRIGTGEGAQSYGHGLYFAESEPVAAAYRNALSPQPKGLPPAEDQATRYLRLTNNRDRAIEQLSGVAKNWERIPNMEGVDDATIAQRTATAKIYRDAVDLLKSGWEPPKSGRMYQVSIKAEPEHFLDWDKPLSEQPGIAARLPQDIRDQLLKKGEETKAGWGDLGRESAPDDYATGQSLHQLLQDKYRDPTKAMEALREMGIPGIKYLDQGSRPQVQDLDLVNQHIEAAKTRLASAQETGKADYIQRMQDELAHWQNNKAQLEGKQTRNYVVFDDKMIDILKKYGLIGLGSLPALQAASSGRLPLSQMMQQPSQ